MRIYQFQRSALRRTSGGNLGERTRYRGRTRWRQVGSEQECKRACWERGWGIFCYCHAGGIIEYVGVTFVH